MVSFPSGIIFPCFQAIRKEPVIPIEEVFFDIIQLSIDIPEKGFHPEQVFFFSGYDVQHSQGGRTRKQAIHITPATLKIPFQRIGDRILDGGVFKVLQDGSDFLILPVNHVAFQHGLPAGQQVGSAATFPGRHGRQFPVQ